MDPTPHSRHGRVLAVFTDGNTAARAATRLRRTLGADRVRVGSERDRVDAMTLTQQREADVIGSAAPIGVISGAQSRGAFVLGTVGAVLGALIAAPFALLIDAGDSVPRWILALGFALGGAMALGTAGFVYGGGREPELEGEVRSDSAEIVIAVEERDDAASVKRLLVEAGAVDVMSLDHRPKRREHIEGNTAR